MNNNKLTSRSASKFVENSILRSQTLTSENITALTQQQLLQLTRAGNITRNLRGATSSVASAIVASGSSAFGTSDQLPLNLTAVVAATTGDNRTNNMSGYVFSQHNGTGLVQNGEGTKAIAVAPIPSTAVLKPTSIATGLATVVNGSSIVKSHQQVFPANNNNNKQKSRQSTEGEYQVNFFVF